jgi:hypothetical protein
MSNVKRMARLSLALSFLLVGSAFAYGQRSNGSGANDTEFGPVMRAYLGYLKNEQEVVDDRASRREISAAYYRRNSNRIHALRQMATRLVRQNGNDYVPELEAVTVDEFGTLFENPPKPNSFHQNEVLANKFRFLGIVHAGEPFYLFARLDPYEQADLIQRQSKAPSTSPSSGNTASGGVNSQKVGQTSTRPRRAVP